jgi:hypothetical protein
MERFVFGVVVAAVALVLLCGSAAWAQETFTFYADSDAWVSDANPTANYGNYTYVSVKDRSGVGESFIRFKDDDLATLSGRTVSSASLFMYQYAGTYSPGDTVNAHAVQAGWQEGAVTWDTKPSYNPQTVGSLELTSGINLWREIPVLQSVVQNWQAGNNFGLALESNKDGKQEEFLGRFYSSEYSDQALRPYMKVAVTPEPVSMLLFGLGGVAMSVAKMRK